MNTIYVLNDLYLSQLFLTIGAIIVAIAGLLHFMKG